MKILEKVLHKITPSEKELGKMNSVIDNFVSEIEKKIKKRKINGEVFVGGSSGKGTVVIRKNQDIDIFIRFSKEKDMSKLENIIPGKIKKIHGSRDYFKVSFRGFGFEVVPVLKIKKPHDAKNVTDLSYFHVSYVKKKLNETRSLADDIRLAKSFCFSNNVYGAESYIKGFSGYSLELLIIYYNSFEKMLKELGKINVKNKKLIIDMENKYKGKKIEDEMNESKLQSPIIFIDPTYKERNILAGLSYETFYKFQEAVRKFLKKPSKKFFFPQKINKNRFNLILNAKTSRQEGDIAGSKLWKFFLLIERQLSKYFVIQDREFDYQDKKSALMYFKIKNRKYILREGPPITRVENVVKFKKKHKNVFIKKGVVFSKEKTKSTKKFLLDFKKLNKKKMRDMGIVSLS